MKTNKTNHILNVGHVWALARCSNQICLLLFRIYTHKLHDFNGRYRQTIAIEIWPFWWSSCNESLFIIEIDSIHTIFDNIYVNYYQTMYVNSSGQINSSRMEPYLRRFGHWFSEWLLRDRSKSTCRTLSIVMLWTY